MLHLADASKRTPQATSIHNHIIINDEMNVERASVPQDQSLSTLSHMLSSISASMAAASAAS